MNDCPYKLVVSDAPDLCLEYGEGEQTVIVPHLCGDFGKMCESFLETMEGLFPEIQIEEKYPFGNNSFGKVVFTALDTGKYYLPRVFLSHMVVYRGFGEPGHSVLDYDVLENVMERLGQHAANMENPSIHIPIETIDPISEFIVKRWTVRGIPVTAYENRSLWRTECLASNSF